MRLACKKCLWNRPNNRAGARHGFGFGKENWVVSGESGGSLALNVHVSFDFGWCAILCFYLYVAMSVPSS
jgi:hypothetical protein